MHVKKDIVLKSYDVDYYHMNYYSKFMTYFFVFSETEKCMKYPERKRQRFFKYSLFVLHKKQDKFS